MTNPDFEILSHAFESAVLKGQNVVLKLLPSLGAIVPMDGIDGFKFRNPCRILHNHWCVEFKASSIKRVTMQHLIIGCSHLRAFAAQEPNDGDPLWRSVSPPHIFESELGVFIVLCQAVNQEHIV